MSNLGETTPEQGPLIQRQLLRVNDGPLERSLPPHSSYEETSATAFRRHTAHTENPYTQHARELNLPKYIRPASYCPSVDSAMHQRRGQSSQPPTLTEVLANTAPPPYTLSAFMAFLSQNHCLETLEFVLDASRYRQTFLASAARSEDGRPQGDEASRLVVLWKRLVDAYVRPCAPREVNLPAHVRDPLIRLALQPTPPAPEALDHAVSLTVDLMRDSVLAPFLASMKRSIQLAEIQSQRNSSIASLDSKRSSLSSNRLSVAASPGSQFSPTTSCGSRFSITSPTSGQLAGSATPCSEHSPNGGSESGESDVEETSSPVTPPSTPPSSEQGLKWSKKMRDKLRWKKQS